MADWEGLPAELLLRIAGFCSFPTALLGVCKTWREGLESCVTSLKVRPILALNLAARFHSLTDLDLRGCHYISPAAMETLGPLPRVSFTLPLQTGDCTPAMAVALRGLGLERLLLTYRFGGDDYESLRFSDSHLWVLEGLPISKMFLLMNASDFGMAALRGMPMQDLYLDGSFSDVGLCRRPRGHATHSFRYG